MRSIFVMAFSISLLTLVADARAQLFGGTRRQGTPVHRPAGTGNNAEVGAIRGNERFVRGNRRRTDFVGTAARDQGNFIGSTGGVTGQVRAATEGLEIETTEEANERLRAATQQHDVMYDPRLHVDFDFTPPSSEAMASNLAHRLALSHSAFADSVSLSVKDQTVTLRGEVPTEHDRALIELLLLLEPGVDRVRNNLTVKSASGRTPLPPPTRPAGARN